MGDTAIVITGANGPLGSLVARHLDASGHEVIGLSRKGAPSGFTGNWRTCDLLNATAVRERLPDARIVVHCASNVQNPYEDVQALHNLIEACRESELHLVYVSICGIEQAAGALEYYAMKVRNEETLRASGVPHTVVRISQFHSFLSMLLSYQAEEDRLVLPRMTLQPIDTDFAAQQLASYALLPPDSRSFNVHGPETLDSEQLGRAWCKARNKAPAVTITDQGTGLLQAFTLLKPVEGVTGGSTWSEWLMRNQPADNPFGEK
jgi:uncharacterized protein YbjT (DUF2867 family)